MVKLSAYFDGAYFLNLEVQPSQIFPQTRENFSDIFTSKPSVEESKDVGLTYLSEAIKISNCNRADLLIYNVAALDIYNS